jgi:hypothetical protein
MIVDVARRTYSARCRFVAGQPPGIIRWYATLPGAKFLPFATAFGGSQFDRGTGLGLVGPGEVRGGFISFLRPNLPPRLPGQQPTGTPQLFLQGLQAPCNKPPAKGPPWPCRTQALDSLNGV